tara:strand:- start:5 stop:1234 length:1230 start_codon:yes stop_codon:yes gene_type:complete
LTWFNPFRIIVPQSDKAHLVASRSYVSYGKAELQDKLDRNPYSFLHVINPSGSGKAPFKRGSESFYGLVRERFEFFLSEGWLTTNNELSFAIYRQSSEHHTCTGIVGTLSVDGIKNGRLKLHEQTLESREKLFAKYLETVGCHAEPVLCVYPDHDSTGAGANAYMSTWIDSHRPDMDFTTTDRIRHTVWLIGTGDSQPLSSYLNTIPAMYLADGHHRIASSLRLAKKYPNQPSKQHVLAFAVPASQLAIRPFHRIVLHPGWNTDQWESAFDSLRDYLSWRRITDDEVVPSDVGNVQVHTSDQSWELKWAESLHAHGQVDAALLQEYVFKRLLGIEDPRNDPRLNYAPGFLDTAALKAKYTSQSGQVLFKLHAVTSRQLMDTADEGRFLPPKSTWIEPKLRSGLFIHEIQ